MTSRALNNRKERNTWKERRKEGIPGTYELGMLETWKLQTQETKE